MPKRMIKALFIDAEHRTVTDFEFAENDYGAIGRKIGCDMIEVATIWATGDVLYVDEEFLGKPIAHWFLAVGNPQPLGGHGVVTGPDRHSGQGDSFKEWTDDVQMTAVQVSERVRFLTRAQVDSWGKANASDVGASITTVNLDTGEEETTALTSMGALYAGVPPVKED